ncbi:hypothetical protein CAURIC_07645 [Corynebacterium auriscanis]|nr:hypothetical protein CAURIC_07645 [Corynebacterium auriscanis]
MAHRLGAPRWRKGGKLSKQRGRSRCDGTPAGCAEVEERRKTKQAAKLAPLQWHTGWGAEVEGGRKTKQAATNPPPQRSP